MNTSKKTKKIKPGQPAPPKTGSDPIEALKAALSEEQASVSGLFDAIGEIITIQDAEFRIIYQNKAQRDFAGAHVGEYCYAAYEGRSAVCEQCALLETFKDGEIHKTEKRVLMDGKRYYAEFTASPVRDPTGKIIAGIEVIRNITERKQAEEDRHNLAALVENSTDFIMIASLEGRVLYMNSAGQRLVGLDTADEAKQTVLEDYHAPEDARRLREEIMPALLHTGTWKGQCRFKHRKTGLPVPVEMNGFTIKNLETGEPVAIAAVNRDITDQIRMEEELLKKEKLESLGILAGGIAHDFNNLLTAILGGISLAMLDTPPEGPVYARLEEVERASLRAKDLTQQLLTFSKGGTPIKKTLELGAVLKEATGFALMGSNVRSEFSIPPDLWPVDADAGQISQVFHNLIINADHAMPQGGTIVVSCENIIVSPQDRLSLNAGKYVAIRIRDRGIGIPKEHLTKIFDPYFTTKQKGSGLGLSTAYSIIKKHDGHISVESSLGSWTLFTIHLPASEKTVPHAQTAKETLFPGTGRVLLMDDEQDIRNTAGSILTRLGYDVAFAKDGGEAIELYKTALKTDAPFDAVIMDLTVPGGLGGKETIERLLVIDPAVRAIVSSGYSNDPIMAEHRAYGFRGVIEKPYRTQQLAKVVHDVLTK